MSMRLHGSEYNNFVQQLAMTTENYVCGLQNTQRQLDTPFKHTKSSSSFRDIIHHARFM